MTDHANLPNTHMPMHLAFVMWAMDCGGAERQVADLTANMVALGHQVTLFIGSGKPSFYPLDPRVRVVAPPRPPDEHARPLRFQWQLFLALCRFIREYHPQVIYVLLVDTTLTLILASFFTRVRVIACEVNNPIVDPQGKKLRLLRKMLFPFVDGMILQTARVREWYRAIFRGPFRVVPNPLDCRQLPARWTGEREKVIVSVGRLEAQKDHATLIRAFALVHARHADYRLVIYGEGSLRAALEAQRAALSLTEVVALPGSVKDIYQRIYKVAIFAFATNYEGYPYALMEALALGIPTVSSDCLFGPADMITDRENGLLVPVGDAEALAGAIMRLIENPAWVDEMGRKALAIRDVIDCPRVTQEYLALAAEVTAHR